MIKVFLLGRPGCGKSTAFRHIEKLACSVGWSAVHLNDYDILREMFHREQLFPSTQSKRRFRATEHGGFDVVDFSVLDEVLRELEKQVRKRYSQVDEVVVIEFARDNYDRALQIFSSTFLQDSYILFIESGLNVCLQRVCDRVAHPHSEDDHFVSEHIIRDYYQKQILPTHLKSGHSFHKGRITIVKNTASKQSFLKNLSMLLEEILKSEGQTYTRSKLLLPFMKKHDPRLDKVAMEV
ncbi:MAG: hypothetical protein ACRDIV_17115 [Ktedonobacteraceae bacterium]